MKIRDIQGGIPIPLSNVENKLAKYIEKKGQVYKDNLNEQDAELAERMVARGILNRHKNNNDTFFTFNGLEDVWRNR